jgi:hypothetical protein
VQLPLSLPVPINFEPVFVLAKGHRPTYFYRSGFNIQQDHEKDTNSSQIGLHGIGV